jgi:acyl-CoA synthetase (AMP-forming)/AMP-acid ligase II
MQATSSLWRALLEQQSHSLAGLRILTSGEAHAADLAERTVSGHVTNLYGTTETTSFSTSTPVEPETSIGRPIWNTRVYVLDDRLWPSPAGNRTRSATAAFRGRPTRASVGGYFCRSASRVDGVTPVSSCGATPFREAANESGIGWLDWFTIHLHMRRSTSMPSCGVLFVWRLE